MTPVIGDTVVAVGESLATSIIVKATATAGIALLGARLARNSRAAVHHLVFVAAFVTLLIIPIATIGLPTVDLPLATVRDTGSSFGGISAGDTGSITEVQRSAGQINAPISIDLPISKNALLFVLWAATALSFLLPVAVGLWQLCHARRFAHPWPNVNEVVRQLASEAGIHRPVSVLLHESVTGPMTCGLFRPMILFPVDAPTWSSEDARRAMIHEMEHIRRGDWLVHCVARIVCAFYWFHPLVWMSWGQLRLAAERACDDAVLRSGDPIGYATQLVTLAERLSPQSKRPLLAMASRDDLSARVTAVLNAQQQRGRTGRLCMTVILASALLFAAGLAPVRAIARPETQSTAVTNENRLAFEVASIKPFSGRGLFGFQILPGGRVTGRPALFEVIAFAYGIPLQQVEGDSPILSERFEIEAKAPPNVIPDEMLKKREDAEQVRRPFQLMFQTLLAERFKLAIHKQTKELPVYALVIGKNGSRLKPETPDWECTPDEKCGFGGGPAGGLSGHAEILVLAQALSHFVDRQVVDRTGLKGRFEIELPSWNPTNPLGTQVRLDDNDEPPPNPNDASIFTVLQERLGLKLEAGRAQLDVYVVDHVERPIPN